MLDDAIASIQQQLEQRAQAETKDWWERYLKGAIDFRGVKMAGIRQSVHAWHAEEGSSWTAPRLRELAIGLIRCDLAEDKLAGILMLQEILLPSGAVPWRTELRRWARLFDDGSIADWNTCDWFCVRVLGPLAAAEGEDCARAIADWRTARNLWRRRAASVAFVNLAPRGDANFPGFSEMLLETCARSVRYRDRFAQTGVGWTLRELSKAEPGLVAGFVSDHLADLSREAVRMAAARLADTERRRLLEAHGANPDSRPGRR